MSSIKEIEHLNSTNSHAENESEDSMSDLSDRRRIPVEPSVGDLMQHFCEVDQIYSSLDKNNQKLGPQREHSSAVDSDFEREESTIKKKAAAAPASVKVSQKRNSKLERPDRRSNKRKSSVGDDQSKVNLNFHKEKSLSSIGSEAPGAETVRKLRKVHEKQVA